MPDQCPDQPPYKVVLEHKGTFNSDGKITTPGANTEYVFVKDDGAGGTEPADTANALTVKAISDDMNIKVNGDPRKIFIAAGDAIKFKGVNITDMIVVESGVELAFVGGYF